MGVYESTLRSETRVISGIEIGRFTYAYKHSWDNMPGGRSRTVRRAEFHAETAADKNRKVRHFIMADSFDEATKEGYFVHQIDRDPPMSCSELRDSKVIGYIRRDGRRFVLHSLAEKSNVE